ncbi:hypothetical protein LTR53_012369 [Teratosphaeriaceae sp. CCFEE 6253]|nr:hypothetical protein LTR53_013116 [Teratosphaeriaceae sp. CCFEE 6253]KAK3111915.1 hypothetical protein LTR53_012369 [Teratosphaeriaceae sp. CCFEE 6253]
MPVLQPQGSHFGLILPLCTSSATVGLALFQYPVFLSFLHAQPSIAGKPLSRFWDHMIAPGASLVAAIALTSTVAGVASARWLSTHATLETTSVSQWYTYGAVLAAGHLAFGPLVVGPIRRMIEVGQSSTLDEEDADRRNREEMKTWLTVHTARTLLVDLPALLCFAEGAALSFWVI